MAVPQIRPRSAPDPGRRRLSPTSRPAGGTEPPALLDSLIRILRTRKWWVLQGLVIVPLIAVLLTLRQEEQYTAEANLLFRDTAADVLDEGGGDFEDPQRAAATNEGLIELPVIAERTSVALASDPRVGRISPATITISVAVSSDSGSDLATISAEHPNPYVAARMANEYGEAYIEFRRRSDQRELQEAIDLAQTRLAGLPPEQRTSAVGQNLEERLNRLLLAQSLLTGGAELVQRATVPSDPSSPDLRRNLVLGLLVGGVLGLGLGALRDRLDRTIKDEDELEQIYGVPVLARLPRSRALTATRDTDDLERAPEAEAFRILRANLRYFDVDERVRSLLISSPQPGDGKSTVARGLAMTMAALGDHVVLVEADLHKARSGALGDQVPERGLSSVLAGEPLDDALVHVPVGGGERRLTLLPSGPVPPNPVELLESSRMLSLLKVLERRFELVVVDSPALANVSDARPLVGAVSGVLLVSAVGRTTRSAAVDFRKQIDLLEGHVLGVVANLSPTPRRGYYY
jgi:polysaccharide biosynthesis transport protein